ncbi:MAG: glucose dehydrogenase [Chloroflexi bacterium]|nr:glucose dehydrogenase [Chloroflexota bacterium]
MKTFVFLLSVLFFSACAPAPAVETVRPPTQPAPVVVTEPSPPTVAVPSASPIAPPESVSEFPDPQGYQWVVVADGLEQPLDVQHAGDGSGRLFVVEQEGRIRIIQNGRLLETPFLDVRKRVGSRKAEQGLLGLAFHPRYAENGLFFVNYTDRDGNTVVARFHVSADPNQADPASETALLHVEQPYSNHNGGGLVFGPDGYLYIGLGDGGSGGDPHGNGQSLDTMLGKMLRIDVDGGELYAVPADNPFVSGGGLPEIWAYGLRNPWRYTFDAATGDLYIGDVGQELWEEIDYLPAGTPGGVNFGWNYMEGTHVYAGQPPAGMALVAPVMEYGHEQGCSVTGGVVYRGADLPEWQGVYLYADFCSRKIWGLLPVGGVWQARLLFETRFTIAAFGQDERGEVYLADYGGAIYRLDKR